MKFASLTEAGYGLVTDSGVQPVPRSFQARYPTLRCALAAGALEAAAEAASASEALAADTLSYASPIPDAGRILCIGMNYREHIREMGREPPEYPALFVRYPDSFAGHGQPLVRPKVSTQFDYEGELAVVIGRVARYISRAEALSVVGGYTILMDGSIRDYQRHTSQFTAGKNFPRSGAMGPWLVTADEIPDPGALELRTTVSGEVLQQGSTADLCIDVPAIIEYLSTTFELQPGDVIATGTPAGVGFARKPPRWLEPGDTVEIEISGLGMLRNPVVAEA